eukprot:TRINITY_DN7758_c1_g1_i1.p1 TRINITY_DN7758_c1_g1~~TRINITY_DN7758_c1_g1_i1.p1  ORF type:complete len:126 (-),score=41.27 TRINITY_DN7758_c1_g1_i1:24-401(-)
MMIMMLRSDSMSQFKCYRCRALLFTENQLESHSQGQGQQAFGYHKRDMYAGKNAKKCTSYFIEQPDFLTDEMLANNQDKLKCPNCEFRLGDWTWSGMQCSCGKWIVPAFQVVKSKVDKQLMELEE